MSGLHFLLFYFSYLLFLKFLVLEIFKGVFLTTSLLATFLGAAIFLFAVLSFCDLFEEND